MKNWKIKHSESCLSVTHKALGMESRGIPRAFSIVAYGGGFRYFDGVDAQVPTVRFFSHGLFQAYAVSRRVNIAFADTLRCHGIELLFAQMLHLGARFPHAR